MPCPHSDDLEPEWCTRCKGTPDIDSPITVARYLADCPGCAYQIQPGQQIIMRYLRWYHVGCQR